jgi:prepilin-type N-terminal cleavage/methylation domain-containing protein
MRADRELSQLAACDRRKRMRKFQAARACERAAAWDKPRSGKNRLVAGAGGVTVKPVMKKLPGNTKVGGFTLIELLVVVAVIAVLAAMLLPALSRSGPSNTARCMSNLKQIDLGYIMWANDHAGQFPAQVGTTDKGSMEFVSTGYASLHFRSLSDYLKFPNVFVCPLDKSKQLAKSTKDLRDENLSYFINLEATTNNPSHTILAGDRNLQANGQPVKPGLFGLTTNLDMSWTHDLHLRGGILAFTDGHVQFVKTNDLNSFIRSQPLVTNRLCVP